MSSLPITDDASPATVPPTVLEDAVARQRLQRRRASRLRIVAMASRSYCMDTLLLLLLAGIGATSFRVALAYGAASLVVWVISYRVLGSDWPERFRDHHLSMPFMLLHAMVSIVFVWAAPEIGILLLHLLFIIFAFCSVRSMGRTGVLYSAAVVTVAFCISIALWGDRLQMPTATWQQRVVCALWFAAVFARIVMLGQFGARLQVLLTQRNDQLAATTERLDLLAHRDELTGALNRRCILQRVEQAHERLLLLGEGFAVALFDLDQFKQINDRFGHFVGDEVLRRFTHEGSTLLRTTDELGRYGGEEFLLLLSATADEGAAFIAAERVRTALAGQDWSALAADLQVTLSAGLAISRPGESTQAMLQRADMALYQAKREGRNQLRVA